MQGLQGDSIGTYLRCYSTYLGRLIIKRDIALTMLHWCIVQPATRLSGLPALPTGWWDNGKENRNYYSILGIYRDHGIEMETTIVYSHSC